MTKRNMTLKSKGYHPVQLMKDNHLCNAMIQMQDPESDIKELTIMLKNGTHAQNPDRHVNFIFST